MVQKLLGCQHILGSTGQGLTCCWVTTFLPCLEEAKREDGCPFIGCELCFELLPGFLEPRGGTLHFFWVKKTTRQSQTNPCLVRFLLSPLSPSSLCLVSVKSGSFLANAICCCCCSPDLFSLIACICTAPCFSSLIWSVIALLPRTSKCRKR